MTDIARRAAPDPYDFLPQVPLLMVTSDDVADGDTLKPDQVMAAGNISPHLAWSPGPEGTQSYVVTCFDADAPVVSGFWHWVVVDIPASITSLRTGAGADDSELPDGAFHVRNDLNQHAFVGAAPPAGDQLHTYHFAVAAVSEPSLEVNRDATPAMVGFNLAMKTLARGVIRGTFQP